MKKAIKLAIAGAVLGGLGYIFLIDQRKLSARAQNAESVFKLGAKILEYNEENGGMPKEEYVQTVTNLVHELMAMEDEKDIEAVRFRLQVLANADGRWKVLAMVFDQGVSAL